MLGDDSVSGSNGLRDFVCAVRAWASCASSRLLEPRPTWTLGTRRKVGSDKRPAEVDWIGIRYGENIYENAH